ncbi:MAG: DUF4184 family protein [Cyanobacteria bacterium J06627_28]
MPFTLSHPIAVWPLWRLSQKRLDLAALSVGAMVPDISYFLALRPVGNVGHSLAGIFLEGIPSGLALLVIGRYLLWRPMLLLMPRVIASRLPVPGRYSFLPLSRVFNIVVSIGVGALTHILWDSFTHARGWGVEQFGVLSREIGISPVVVPMYKWLQYGGGVVGLAIILGLITVSLQAMEPHRQQSQLSTPWVVAAWAFILCATMVTVAGALFPVLNTGSLSALVVGAVIGCVSGFFVGCCLYAVAFWAYRAFSQG